jgi:hypothetical protein
MKQYLKKIKLLLLVFLPFISIAQTNLYKQDSSRLVMSAYKTLHGEMSNNDFKKLSWEKIMVDTLSADLVAELKSKSYVIEPILKISAKNDTSRFILYTEQTDKKYYNWVLLSLSKDSAYYSGKVETYTVKNQLINSWKIKRNRVIEGNGKSYANLNTDSIPGIILIMTNTTDGSDLLSMSINQLLFNGTLKRDNPLSSTLCFLNYNFIILNPFFNGYQSMSSGPIPVEQVAPGNN